MSNFSFLDKNLLRTRALRAAHLRTQEGDNAASVDFLLRWAEKEMIERLNDIRHEIKQCAVLSPAPSQEFLDYLLSRGIKFEIFADLYLSDDEILPLERNRFDAVISFFELHKINDLPGWLVQIRSTLKEDGVLIACLAGEATLFQLRQSLLAAEMNILGGASPRVMPFISKQQMAGLLQRAGFTLPVVDSETVTATYESIFTLMKDLRLMGETNAMIEKYKSFSPPGLFIETSKIYAERFAEENGRLPATFDVTFLIGWSPSDTQQKPLRRGSGQVNLADFLASDTQSGANQEKE
ncbi:MAG: class I SAM-dependent methyltransferase [Pseudobdellovibrionaceae bacterium]|jgi:SAM-dependent methyltransferase|nr:class I SAM-dependent methyltransferase [Pseudobdellovibrionaceae bacterium]